MVIRLELKVTGALTQTKKTAERLVKEAPSIVSGILADELKRGDGGAGAAPLPARPDSVTGWPVRTGLSRRSFRSTHDGLITNEQGYTARLERKGKWKGTGRRFIQRRLIEAAEKHRDRVLSKGQGLI